MPKEPYNHKSMLGKHLLEETKKLIGNKIRGIKRSEETKQRIRLAKLGKPHFQSLETKKKIGLSQIGKKFTEETKAKMRLLKLGKKQSEETRQKRSNLMMGHFVSDETRNKISKIHKGRKCPWAKPPIMFGKNNPRWKGGVTLINEQIRKSLEYRLWRKAVFERDNYTCIFCGQCGGDLEADHIKPFSDYPELRFAIDNGRTLCVNCHHKTETFGFNYWLKRL